MSQKKYIVLKNTVTQYHPIQDRICIAGTFLDEGLITVWLTQKMLQQLLLKLQKYPIDISLTSDEKLSAPKDTLNPKLKEKLDMVKGFAQEMGELNLPNLLIAGVRIEIKNEMRLVYFSLHEDSRFIVIPLTVMNLKKWLKILQNQANKAEWLYLSWPNY